MRKLFSILLVLGSLACGAWVLAHANLPGAWQHVSQSTGAGERWLLLLALIVPAGVAACLHTTGWGYAFGKGGSGMGWGRLFGIRLAGDALNQVTPLMSLGGEPVKAVLFSQEGGDALRGASAVMAARLVMTAAQVLLVGTAVALTVGRFSEKVLFAFAMFPGLVGLGILTFSLVRFWFPVRWRAWMLERPLVARYREGFRAFSRVLCFWQEHPRECLIVFVLSLAGWIAPAGEFWLVARAVGEPLSFADCLVLEGLTASVTMSTFFIPGNLGSQEAGLLYIADLYRFTTPVGPLMVVIRRVREILWIGVGLVVLTALGASGLRRAPAPATVEATGEAPG